MKKQASTSQDLFNHVARGISSNALIQYVVTLAKRIDRNLLQQALRISMETEPILACVLDDSVPKPCWRHEDNSVAQLVVVSTDSIEESVSSILAEELNPSLQLPVKIYLLDDSFANVLVVKISHAVCDGAGSKYYLQLLSDIYTQLEQKDVVSLATKTLVRDTSALYRSLGIANLYKYYDPVRGELPSTWGFPIANENDTSPLFAYRRLGISSDDFKKLKARIRTLGVTVNSAVAAIYFDALISVLSPVDEQKELQLMVDLRRFLPSDMQQPISNLSAVINVEMPTAPLNFDERVKDMDKKVRKVLASDCYIHGTVGVDVFAAAGYSSLKTFFKEEWEGITNSGECTPMLSNVGVLDADRLTFGSCGVRGLFLVPPAFYAPAFMLGVSTFNGVLTLCAGFYKSQIEEECVAKLFAKMDALVKSIVM